MATKRLVIVTGGTGTLGMAVCEMLMQEGYCPILVARNHDALSAATQAYPGNVYTYACDVGNPREVEALYAQPFLRKGTLCGVVAAAGILRMGETLSFSDAQWEETIRINVSGTYYVFRHAIPLLQERGGKLIAIGSRWADGAKHAVAYSASKSALRGMIKALQRELAGSLIQPILVSPGSIAGPMSNTVNEQALDILQPQDVASTILHILKSPQRVIFDEVIIKAYNYDLTDAHAV